jgi:hypothetical protein
MAVAVTHRLHPARLGSCYDSFHEVHGIPSSGEIAEELPALLHVHAAHLSCGSPCWSMTRSGVAGFDGDGLAYVAALPGDLDAAAAGHLPLDGQPGWQLRLNALRRTAGCRPSATPDTASHWLAAVTPADRTGAGTAILPGAPVLSRAKITVRSAPACGLRLLRMALRHSGVVSGHCARRQYW